MPDDDTRLPTLLERRHSCRAFDGRPVPREMVEAIVGLAHLTASWCNSQPWHLVVAGVATTERLRQALIAEHGAGMAVREITPEPVYHGVYQERRRQCGFGLYESVGIARDDRTASARQAGRNFALFDAPQVAILTCDRALGPYGLIDCGGFLSVFLLAAESFGVAAIPLASIAGLPEVIRANVPIREERVIMCGIALGYAAADDPANRFRTDRASLDQVMEWRE